MWRIYRSNNNVTFTCTTITSSSSSSCYNLLPKPYLPSHQYDSYRKANQNEKRRFHDSTICTVGRRTIRSINTCSNTGICKYHHDRFKTNNHSNILPVLPSSLAIPFISNLNANLHDCKRYLSSRKTNNNNNNDNKYEKSSHLQYLENRTKELLHVLSSMSTDSMNMNNSDNNKNNNNTITRMHFDEIMESWSKLHTFYGAQRAEELLVALETNYDQLVLFAEEQQHQQQHDHQQHDQYHHQTTYTLNSALIPNLISYNHVLNAYAQSQGGEQSALKAESLFIKMMNRFQNYTKLINVQNCIRTLILPSPPPEPSLSTIHHVMNTWAKSNVRYAGEKVEELYTLLESMSMNENDDNGNSSKKNNSSRFHPNAKTLAIVFDAWANSTHENAIDRVITTLNHVIEKERQAMTQGGGGGGGGGEGTARLIRLNKIVFHSVLLTLANSTSTQSSSSSYLLSPRSVNALDVARKAEDIMNLLQNLHEQNFYKNQNDDSENDSIENYVNNTNNDDQLLIDYDLKPNTRTWSLLLRCWSNAVNHFDDDGGEYAAQRTDDLLQQMEELFQNGEDVKPNSYCYTSCIQAWSKCRSKKGASRAVEILENKEKMFEETGDEDLKPDTYEYNVCLSALCNASLLDGAKKLLTKMERLGVIDTISFNTVLSAYAKSNIIERHLRVWELFEDMTRLNIELDTITYFTLMDAVGKNRDVDSVHKTIQILQSLIDSNPNKLDVKSFTTVLNAIAKSHVNEKTKLAKEVFKQLLNLHKTTGKKSMTPDITAFGSFFACCANENGSSESKRQALKLMLGTYENLCSHPEYGKPNEYIYGALVKASSRLTQDHNEKCRLLENLFRKCKDDGCMSMSVLETFLKALPKHTKTILLQDCKRNGFSVSVPPDWCRNVPLKRNRPAVTHSQPQR